MVAEAFEQTTDIEPTAILVALRTRIVRVYVRLHLANLRSPVARLSLREHPIEHSQVRTVTRILTFNPSKGAVFKFYKHVQLAQVERLQRRSQTGRCLQHRITIARRP